MEFDKQNASCQDVITNAFVLQKLVCADGCPPLRLERQLPSKSKWKHNFLEESLLYWSTKLGSSEAQGAGACPQGLSAIFFSTEIEV